MHGYDFHDFVEKCRYGTIHQLKRAVLLRSEEVYLDSCQDFGITNPLPFTLEIVPEYTGDFVGKTKYSWGNYTVKTGWKAVSVAFVYPIAICRMYPHVIYRDTVPHEVAHGLVFQIFNEKQPGEFGHGQEWQELAKYMGAFPSPICPEPIDEIACKSYQEPSLQKVM